MKKIIFFILLYLFVSDINAQTFSYPGPAVSIPDNDAVSGGWAEITVSGISPVSEVDYVTINLTHTYDSDLEIVLEFFDNSWILANGNGGSGNNFTNTVFRDGFPSISGGSAPFSGTYAPLTALPKFVDNLNPNGKWTLHVFDLASGDVGTINSWSITFKAPACPTVGFGTLPASMNCNAAAVTLYASDLITAGGPDYPALFFEFNIVPSAEPNMNDNVINIYEDGNSIYNDIISDPTPTDAAYRLTVYYPFPGCSPSSNYTFTATDNDGTMTWVVYDENGTYYTGSFTNTTVNEGPWSPQGTSSWTCTPTNGITGTGDWGAAIFDPSVVGAGTYTITFNWNNQGTGAHACSGSPQHSVTVVNPFSFTSLSYSSPVCKATGGTISPSLNATTGGSYTSSGGLSINSSTGVINVAASTAGTYTVTYTVGTLPCGASGSATVTIIPDVNPAWTNPSAICASAGSINLNNLITGTTGGTWSGTGVSGNTFNPSFGTQSVTYTVGTSPCQETSTQTITVAPDVNPAWTNPGAICASAGSINLNNLITGTIGGT